MTEVVLTAEEFLAQAMAAFNEAQQSQIPFTFTISMLHPRDKTSEASEGVYEYDVDGIHGNSFTRPVLAKDIMSMIDYFSEEYKHIAPITTFSRNTLDNSVYMVFEDLMDHEELDQFMPILSAAAINMGLYSRLTVQTSAHGDITYAFSYGVQVYADTAAMEMDMAKQLGVEATHTPSDPNRLIPIGEVIVNGLSKL